MANEIDDSEKTINAEWAAIEQEVGGGDSSSAAVSVNPGLDRKEAREPVAGLLSIIFTGAFGWFLPAWNVGKDEIDNLSSAWAAMVTKYLPRDWLEMIAGNGSGGLEVEGNALKVTISVCRPRMSKRQAVPVTTEKKPVNQPVEQQPVKPVTGGKDSSGDDMWNIGGS